jgi:hypothetical protein
VIVLSALATAAAYRVGKVGGEMALEIKLPGELLAAMGISAASFIGTPLVLSVKSTETPAADDIVKSMRRVRGAMRASGKVFGREHAASAEWMDMFRGDEVGNAATPDLSKVQQFGFTLMILAVYGAAVMQQFMALPTKASFDQMPALHENLLVLMGISHASYLVYKAAPHTKSAPSEGDATGPIVRSDVAPAAAPPPAIAPGSTP